MPGFRGRRPAPADLYQQVVAPRPSSAGATPAALSPIWSAPWPTPTSPSRKAEELAKETRQKKIETRQKELEQIRWQRNCVAQMHDEEQERIVKHELKVSKRERPPLTEVLAGRSLNVLLKDLSRESRPSDGTSVAVREARPRMKTWPGAAIAAPLRIISITSAWPSKPEARKKLRGARSNKLCA